MEIGGADPHSDAYVVKMTLVFSGTQWHCFKNWVESSGNQSHKWKLLSRIAHVSGRCRLSRSEEMLVDLCQVSYYFRGVEFPHCIKLSNGIKFYTNINHHVNLTTPLLFFLQLSETSLPQALTNRVTFLSILESALDSSTSEGSVIRVICVATMIPEPPKFMDYDTM